MPAEPPSGETVLTWLDLWVRSLEGFLAINDVIITYSRTDESRPKKSRSLNLRRNDREADIVVWDSGEGELIVVQDSKSRAVQEHLEGLHDPDQLARALSQALEAISQEWTTDACCDVMRGQVELECPDHTDPVDCPDAVVVRSMKGDFRFPIRDGGSSFIGANFCPWCGRRLPGAGTRR